MLVLDYSAGVPDAAAIKAAGYGGAVRYISPARADWMVGKPISRGEVSMFELHGLELAFVWQYGKDADSDVMRGREGGIADARAAQEKLDELGRGNHPVFFAVDFDIDIAQWNEVAVEYFRACCEILGRDRVGIYGHSRVISWAVEDHVIANLGGGKHLAWQTVAWSHGEIADEAVLFQRAGQVNVGGVECDVNDVWHDYWGQELPPTSADDTDDDGEDGEGFTPNPQHYGDPLFLPDVLRAFEVDVEEWDGWEENGHGDFGKIQGIIVHHTGTNRDIPGYIANHPDLGLCSQIHLNRDGTAVVVGAGIAWHAGMGDYPGWPTNGANQVSIGIEAASDGVSPWPAEMLDAYYRTCAAILYYLGKDATTGTLLGHKEYSGRAQGKWDPGGIDMDLFRTRVQYYIDNPPFSKEKKGNMKIMGIKVPSWVNPTKVFSIEQALANIDLHVFNCVAILKEIAHKLGIDADKVIEDATKHDRGEGNKGVE